MSRRRNQSKRPSKNQMTLWSNRRNLFKERARSRRVRRLPTGCSIANWNRTATGAKLLTTASSGSRVRPRTATGGHIPTAGGFIPTRGGPGCPKSHLGGRLITTGDGSACGASAGFGCRAMNGRRPGSRGEQARITSVGRRCRRKRVSIGGAASAIGRTIITISAPTSMPSFRITNSARGASGSRWCRSSAM
jgi:hypothetical protein